MKLKNYTSSVPVARSVGEIEKLLVEAGATHIAKWYDGKTLAGVIFQLNVAGIPRMFKLPSKPDAVRKVMVGEIKKPRRGTVDRVSEQAERTAWKLLQDWVAVQISMVALEQAEAVQVFLPYLYDERSDRTLFEHFKESGFKQLTEGK